MFLNIEGQLCCGRLIWIIDVPTLQCESLLLASIPADLALSYASFGILVGYLILFLSFEPLLERV